MNNSRREFLKNVGLASFGAVAANEFSNFAVAESPQANALGDAGAKQAGGESILGKSGIQTSERPKGIWKPVSDRKIRVGIVGYGRCQFGALFGYQDHPNVTVTAVSDLIPERCAGLAKACRCAKIYPSLEEMVKDDSIEAVYIATDAPHHAEHAVLAMKHGKHVVCAVPAVYGSLEDADKLLEAVKTTGKKYMMNETSAFHPDLHAMRQIYAAGGFGKLVYTEGEYYHYMPAPLESFKNWRVGMPPQWYPTHSNAYYTCVSGGRFTEVECMGMPSEIPHMQAKNNPYQNPFGTEVALLRTSEGGMARMVVSFDTPRKAQESGRVRGQRGSMAGMIYEGLVRNRANIERPQLPPTVQPGAHFGSHGPLTNEFIESILLDRKPLVDVVTALNTTVAGIVAHQSALKNGEHMKIPQYSLM